MKESIFKLLYYFGTPTLLRISKKNFVTILSLHRISDERDYFFDPIKPETFEKLLQYCCKHYTVTTFEGINTVTEKPKLILSFDDGYYDFIEIALPMLKKMGLPSNHNVVNACINNNETIWTQELNDIFNFLKNNNITNNETIGNVSSFQGNWMSYYMHFFNVLLQINRSERNAIIKTLLTEYNIVSKYRMMNWEDIIYCSNNDVEIGCHTYNHDSLISIKDASYYYDEINKSIVEISDKIGKKVTILALPNGQYNADVLEYIRKLDINYLLLVDDKVNATTFNPTFNLISRIMLGDNSFYETVLKTELFHSKIKKIYG